MLAVCIILVVLLLLLIIPVGADVRYEEAFSLRLKIGPLKFTLIPGKKKPKKKPEKKPSGHKVGKAKEKPKQKLTVQDILTLSRIGLDALGRLRRSLSIDLFRLHVLVAAPDPYDAVIRYGALNAGLGVLSPAVLRALRFRREDVRTDVDVQGSEGSIDFRLQATLQIWEVLWIALCAGWAFLKWNAQRKKSAKAGKKVKETIQEEKAS